MQLNLLGNTSWSNMPTDFLQKLCKPLNLSSKPMVLKSPRLKTNGPFRTLTGHRMPRCSFPAADINWSSNFSIHKLLSMCSCTTRTLHVSRVTAILGYAAQVSVRAGSVIAHLSSLNRDGPLLSFTSTSGCCGAARRSGHSCIAQHFVG
jgi:hypothetical protein